MDLNVVKDYLGEDWQRVQRFIADSLKSGISLLDETNESILSHAGKQIRPLLSLLVARACAQGRGPLPEASYLYAASSELLHNATLLHDDVADNSDRRRGSPTIMSLMGPSVSVLIGDYWLVKAMEDILAANDGDAVIRLFSKTLSDLAEGEMLQLEKARSGDTDEEDYRRIIFSKTASLFKAAAVSAAISVGASQDVKEKVGEYATLLGMAFQIRDDIFDYMVLPQTGKPAGIDVLEQKITLPLLGALSNAEAHRAEKIRSMVQNIGDNPQHRDEIIEFVRHNGGVEYAKKALDRYIANAVDCLDVLKDSEEKNYLEQLAFFVGERIS